MKFRTILMAVTAAIPVLATPAGAAFYFQGLAPFTQAPSCNDVFAIECDRRDHLQEDGSDLGKVPHRIYPRAIPKDRDDMSDRRYKTRKGLDK